MDNSIPTGMTTHAGRSLLQETARFSNEGKIKCSDKSKNKWDFILLHEFVFIMSL